ncbi:hypothetical protein CCS01_09880 [Rhodopila globiformis]|uniref:Uncharacterized protein n=1 Tax=Rhodopila globiformis TaxID=1071 RepID=A0A2S6NJ52_RHOGL|nr:hypothetical protein CCS01_09880 [Rhodopila globiformis]
MPATTPPPGATGIRLKRAPEESTLLNVAEGAPPLALAMGRNDRGAGSLADGASVIRNHPCLLILP